MRDHEPSAGNGSLRERPRPLTWVPTAYGGGPWAAPVVSQRSVALGCGCAALALAGAFGPWVEVRAEGEVIASARGTDTDGVVVVVAAIVALVAAVALLKLGDVGLGRNGGVWRLPRRWCCQLVQRVEKIPWAAELVRVSPSPPT